MSVKCDHFFVVLNCWWLWWW